MDCARATTQRISGQHVIVFETQYIYELNKTYRWINIIYIWVTPTSANEYYRLCFPRTSYWSAPAPVHSSLGTHSKITLKAPGPLTMCSLTRLVFIIIIVKRTIIRPFHDIVNFILIEHIRASLLSRYSCITADNESM